MDRNDYIYERLEDVLAFVEHTKCWGENKEHRRLRHKAEATLKEVMGDYLKKVSKLQKVLAIAEQELDAYEAEVSSLCILEKISVEELRQIEKRIDRLDCAVLNVIKENE